MWKLDLKSSILLRWYFSFFLKHGMVPWEIATWLSCLVRNSGSGFATFVHEVYIHQNLYPVCWYPWTYCILSADPYAVFSALVTPCSKDTLGLFGTSSIKLGRVRSISRNFTGEGILENTNKRAGCSLNWKKTQKDMALESMRAETRGVEGLDGGWWLAVTELGKILICLHS